MTNVGKNIAAARKRLGITQEELAVRVGYKTKSAINKIELGVRELPQKKIVAFANALDVTPGCLMGWDEEIKKDREATEERHFAVLMDEDFVGMFDEFHMLDEKMRKIVIDLVHSLATTGD